MAAGKLVAIITFVFFCLIVPGYFIIKMIIELSRKKKLESYSLKNGFSFTDVESSKNHKLGSFSLFEQTMEGKFKNKIQAENADLKLSLFEYHWILTGYPIPQGKKQTILLFETTQDLLPDFIVKPQDKPVWLVKLHGIDGCGFQIIEFPSHPDLYKKISIQGGNVEEIKNFFTPERLNLIANKNNRGLWIESSGNKILFYFQYRIKPSEIAVFIESKMALLNQIFGVDLGGVERLK